MEQEANMLDHRQQFEIKLSGKKTKAQQRSAKVGRSQMA
jgi:hypothetical protein